jgi:hypothetical protein
MAAQYRVENWSEYNRALIARGSLNVWISEDAVSAWEYAGPRRPGGKKRYSDLAIETCLSLRLVYSLALRQTQGFVASLLQLLGVELPVPDDSTLSRRHASLAVDLCARKRNRSPDEGSEPAEEPQHVVIDSTGLKVYGEGEWKQRQHGKGKRRTWRKVHVAVDPETGEITATTLTENREHDSSQTESLLDESEENRGRIDTVGADGAYDTWTSYQAIATHGATPIIAPRKNARIKQHGNCNAPPLPREETIRSIRRQGRKRWKEESGYHRRSLAESALGRFKRLLGRALRTPYTRPSADRGAAWKQDPQPDGTPGYAPERSCTRVASSPLGRTLRDTPRRATKPESGHTLDSYPAVR